MNPTKFGRYIVVRQIGGGAFGIVCKALDTSAPKPLWRAVKLFRQPEGATLLDVKAMFFDEARTGCVLHHANIVETTDLDKVDDGYYLAQEYIAGKPLSTLCADHEMRGMPAEMVVHIAIKVCQALRYAFNAVGPEMPGAQPERLNIVHRDVTPANILVGFDGTIKLIDFGVAKSTHQLPGTESPTIIKGKFAYMPPEQTELQEDHRSDLYALGIVMWEMLTGERLFWAENEVDKLRLSREAIIPEPSSHIPSLPPDLERIVMKSLARDPNERYQEARHMRADLMRCRAQLGARYTKQDLSDWMRTQYAEAYEAEEIENARWL